MIGSWEAGPDLGLGLIILFIMFLEAKAFKQDPNKDAGDVVPDNVPWARYPDGYTVPLGDGSSLEEQPARDSTARAQGSSRRRKVHAGSLAVSPPLDAIAGASDEAV